MVSQKDMLTLNITDLIVNKDYTIRQCTGKLKYSKSYIHTFIHTYIYNNYPDTYKLIKAVLDKHNEIKHINGGNATKLLWKNKQH